MSTKNMEDHIPVCKYDDSILPLDLRDSFKKTIDITDKKAIIDKINAIRKTIREQKRFSPEVSSSV